MHLFFHSFVNTENYGGGIYYVPITILNDESVSTDIIVITISWGRQLLFLSYLSHFIFKMRKAKFPKDRLEKPDKKFWQPNIHNS